MSLDASFEDTPVTATVSSAPEAAASATADAGSGDLGAPVQPSAPTANTVAGTSNDPDADLDARAGGLLANKSATDFATIERFLRAVLPWPASEQDDGYVNLHYNYEKNGKTFYPGWAFKTWTDADGRGFGSMAKFAINRPEEYPNLWQCMSLQRENKGLTKTKKNLRAKRLAHNAIALKALWIDIDFKDGPPKTHASEEEAVKALLAFLKKYSFPMWSALVHSGNGLHFYWASDKPLTLDEWRPLAEGFKALLLKEGVKIDVVCTADAARLMRRRDGVRNAKLDPARPA
jgi:hypothetical protein